MFDGDMTSEDIKHESFWSGGPLCLQPGKGKEKILSDDALYWTSADGGDDNIFRKHRKKGTLILNIKGELIENKKKKLC